jgi:hypothetical protein
VNPYYKIPYNVREKLSPRQWLRELRWSRQRVSRGWSDRDTWGGGEYILEVVSGILKKLGDVKSHIDWDEYFKTNYPNNQGYKSLQEVAKDLDKYLAFDEYAWADNLGFEIKHSTKELSNGGAEWINENTPEEERQIKKAIQASHKEWDRRYKKAKKAMTFVAINFPGLWD